MAERFADTLMRSSLRFLSMFAGSTLTDNIKFRRASEKFLSRATHSGFKLAGMMNRPFTAVQKLTQPFRPEKTKVADLFDLMPSEEQAMMQDAMGRFAADRLRPAAHKADDSCKAPAELITEAAGLGTAFMYVPESLGGAAVESSIMTQSLVAESLAHGDMGLALACLAPAGVAAALSEWGTPEQQSTYLPAFATEEPPVASIAVMEPRVLFDPTQLHTRAVQRAEGGYQLDGVKSLVPLAGTAELFLIAAATEDGPALFIVESSTKGLSWEAEPAMGLRAAGLGTLTLEKVILPAAALLGGEAGVNYSEFIARSRLAWASLAVGTAQAVLDYVIPYVNDRVAFGEPISHRQSVAFMVANIGIELEGMRLLTWRAAGRADAGLSFAREAALAKRACIDYGMKIGNDGVQLLGGHGYTKEHPVERWYRDLRAIGVMEGGLLV
jgi:alkylation response protein AidB-like acyl-CoA dehydrogenase